MSSPRLVGFLALVTLGFAVLAVTTGMKATGHHDTAPRAIDASVTASAIDDAAWVTAHGHIDPATLFRSGGLAAFRLQEREDGLVFVVRVQGTPLEDDALWKRAGVLGAIAEAVKKADREARDAGEEEPTELPAATEAYLTGEHELTGAVFAPEVGMNTGTVEVGAESMKLTGVFGSYSGATRCPSPLRAVVVGEKPPTRVANLGATAGYGVLAVLGLGLVVFLVRPAKVTPMAPRGAQIAGETCDVCDRTLVLEKDGVLCETCTNAVHARCLGKHARTHRKAEPYRG